MNYNLKDLKRLAWFTNLLYFLIIKVYKQKAFDANT